MTSLLVGLLLVLVLPLVLSTWRMSLLGLAAQGLLMAWIAHQEEPAPSLEGLVTLVDLAIVRGLLVPLFLYRVMRRQNLPSRNDVISPNMLSWTLAAMTVGAAFRFGALVAPADPHLQATLTVAAAGLLLGLFVLANGNGVFSQAVGALRIENAIALFELTGHHPLAPLPLRIGQVVVFLLTAIFYAAYVRRLAPLAVAPSEKGAR